MEPVHFDDVPLNTAYAKEPPLPTDDSDDIDLNAYGTEASSW
jgi:hypothetical protein